MTAVDPILQPVPEMAGDTGIDGVLVSAETPGLASSEDNQEWQLAELVDAIAGEVERAQDTLGLKSYARGMSFAIQKLSLDLEVNVRRAPDGRILFRTIAPEKTGATVIKLDFAQVLQNQLLGVRKPLDAPGQARPLTTLPDIKPAEINALNALAIFSVDDLERYTQTAAMIGELSRKTGIPDPRIRLWRQLPFLTEPKPARGLGGSTVVLDGGNFGSVADPNAVVLFQGQPAAITAWSESRLTVRMPRAPGAGVVFAVIRGQVTNSLAWEATAAELVVRDILVSPALPIDSEPVTIEASLINQGGGASGGFQVQWIVDLEAPVRQPHGPLQPGQPSMESSIRRTLTLPSGVHTVRFTADPSGEVSTGDASSRTFSKQFVVSSLAQLQIGDVRTADRLDPILRDKAGPGDALRLVFRGLARFDVATGTLVPEIAKAWQFTQIVIDEPEIRRPIRVPAVVIKLRDDVRFHDGSLLTAADVELTYASLAKADSPWSAIDPITDITVNDATTITFVLRRGREIPPQLLTVGIVPRAVYTDPAAFARRPIGTGPFKVDEFVAGQVVRLSSFGSYALGAPRLNRINVISSAEAAKLKDMLLAGELDAVTLPYSEAVLKELQARTTLAVVALPSANPELIHAQSRRVQERMPNALDTNWNAHLWYLNR